MDVCVCVGPNVCGSVYQGDAEPFFCHSELETVLTNRLHAPEFAQALICLCNDPLLDYASVSKALLAVKVLIARSLRTRLFLGCPPAGAGAGGGNGDGGWPGRQGVDVSADGLTVRGDTAGAGSPQQVRVLTGTGAAAAQLRPRPGAVGIAGEIWEALGRFAHRTYVPATEASRLKGAGAGLTDND